MGTLRTGTQFKRGASAALLLLALLVGLLATIGGGAAAQQDPVATEEAFADVEVPDAFSDDPVERGRYLVHVQAACIQCHGEVGPDDDNPLYVQNPLGVQLIGGLEMDINDVGDDLGNVWAPNLTVMQDWTDAEIEAAIRYGVDPDGNTLLPPMSYELYAGMADADMDAIIAYLRSLEPVENEIPEAELAEGVTRDMVRVVPPHSLEDLETMVIEYPEGYEDDPAVRGRYMALHTSACMACHGSARQPEGYLVTIPRLNGIASGEVNPIWPSLLADQSEGWSDEYILSTFNNNLELLPMPSYAYQYLVDEDTEALIAWIRSQPTTAEWEDIKDEEDAADGG